MWELSFISEKNFRSHVRDTIRHYGDKLVSYDLQKFNKNIVDPVKLIFDKNVYGYGWPEIIANEIIRQRDKSNNNDIGYFHQRIFQYIEGCEVPKQGWDVIFRKESGIKLPECGNVKTIYVEMKNKHNTMNSAASGKTYIKMQKQILSDDTCSCFLVEAIAKRSQNKTWKTTVDKEKWNFNRIRRVSMDQFYQIVTGDPLAFYKMCMVLPSVVETVVKEEKSIEFPHDTVLEGLNLSAKNNTFEMAVYMLSFGSYTGFAGHNKNN